MRQQHLQPPVRQPFCAKVALQVDVVPAQQIGFDCLPVIVEDPVEA